MHYHLLQRNSMTVPRVDDKDYALAMDGYGINTGKWTHKSDSRCYRVSWEQKLPRHVLDHGDTVDLAYGTGSYDCVIAIIKPNVDGQIGISARWNIPDSVPAWTNLRRPYCHQHYRVSATSLQTVPKAKKIGDQRSFRPRCRHRFQSILNSEKECLQSHAFIAAGNVRTLLMTT